MPVLKNDIYRINIENNKCKYFHYIDVDDTQLGSHVIRVFKSTYNMNDEIDVNQIINDEIDFHAHVVIHWGIKMGLWKKYGRVKGKYEVKTLFRQSADYGNPEIKYSNEWSVWRINEDLQYVGKLEGENRKAEIGIVVAPHNIYDRVKTGKYNFSYPKFL